MVLEAEQQEMQSILVTDAGRMEASVNGFMLVQLGGLLASLYFMWTVRHPKTE